MVTPPKTNPVFFAIPRDYDSWPEAQQRDWMERQAEALITKLKPDATQGQGRTDG
jgi:hypothetical protein